MEYPNGLLFDESLQKELKEKFCYPDADPIYGERLFFENSGGSLRLKKCVEAKSEQEKFPDCPERIHERSLYLKGLVKKGTKEILEIIFGAKSGALITELTASQTMFHMVGLIMENVEGTNAVVSSLEHPSAFDAIEFYCNKTGKELRVIPANTKTGGIDADEVVKYVDENTCLLSVMSASNISGNIMDIEAIVKKARQIKPDLYIISDAVQHAPHCSIDVEKLQIDGMNFAPYKFFGVRGCGFAYVSERVEILLNSSGTLTTLNKHSYEQYLEERGLHVVGENPIINKITCYNGEYYTAVSNDSLGYPILCKINGNVLEPFAICPEPMTYEFRYFINDNGIFGVYRVPPDDHGTAHIAYTISTDGGKNWNTEIYEDGIQSRPDILEYYGKPLIIYNYKSDKSIENFPRMHNHRNSIKMIYEGKVIFDWFTKYGIVEHSTVSICGDLYMAFSNCPQALSTENGAAWLEEGVRVEQGKEAIQWAKIGYIL